MPATPMDMLLEMRRKAVFRLFNGKYKASTRITVGSATCENAAGAEAVFARFKDIIAETGTKDVSLGTVGCAGRCDLEPMVTVFKIGAAPVKYVKMTPKLAEKIFNSHVLNDKPVDELTMERDGGIERPRRIVSICAGASCLKGGSEKLEAIFLSAIEKEGLSGKVSINRSGCQGMCASGPVAFIYPDGVLYQQVDGNLAERIVREHLAGGKPIADKIWNGDKIANRFMPFFGDIRFFAAQLRLTLRNCGVIDPESIYEYLAVRGYEAIASVLTGITPDDVIRKITRSGLRGRGGAGFPTGLKWKMARETVSDIKYVICNADEGDPGAFMDRSAIEGDPHSIIEGLTIAGYAVGASKGFIYIRAEYPLAVKRLEKAISIAEAAGFLGKNIFGSKFDFEIEIRLGAGAFVCGEETALIHSIEGDRGMPSPRPPYPVERGLWGKPTAINNVETLANVPVVILDGEEWFRSIGTEKSKGTKVFALAGKVCNTGLIEVPMGTTLRDVVYKVGGGIKNGRKFKAIQTGGPAGGCLPESELDTKIDYESLTAAGSIMGSGGLIVMDEDTCMVDVARFFIDFTQNESCGKCVPCREGTMRMREILDRITSGSGREEDLEKLLRLADTIKKSALCGLGQAAPNPVISTIRHFRAEYEAHIRDKKCPARVCKSLVRYSIDGEKCVGCGACRRKCPVSCITGKNKEPHIIDQDSCIRCDTCFQTCKFNAVRKE